MRKVSLYILGLGIAALLGALPSWTEQLSSPLRWFLVIPAVVFCYLLLEGIGSSIFGARGEARGPFTFSLKSAVLAFALAVPFFAVAAVSRYLAEN
jgi:hypothetical protein